MRSLCLLCCHSFSLSLPRIVEGSASWRIPLGVQLVPGLVLAIGCIFLPPSPRLLVAQGRNDEALRTLGKLRLRSEREVQDDPLLRVSAGSIAFLVAFISPPQTAPPPSLERSNVYRLSFLASTILTSILYMFHVLVSPWLFFCLGPCVCLVARWLYAHLDRDARDASGSSTHSTNSGPFIVVVVWDWQWRQSSAKRG